MSKLLIVLFFILGSLNRVHSAKQTKKSDSKQKRATRRTTTNTPDTTTPEITTPRRVLRTGRRRESFKDYCEEDIKYCLRVYSTGYVCGRTINFYYKSFPHYCAMQFLNCYERYELWAVFHMGKCFTPPALTNWHHPRIYEFNDDAFMDQTYVYEYDI